MNRADFQQLAEVRVKEAEALLAAGLWDGAYYLAGYAVECGLKACIAKLTKAEDFPPEKKFVDDCYSHNLVRLRELAQLTTAFKTDAPTGSVLENYWDTVKDWTERSRYARIPEAKARQMYSAVADPTNGVLQWIKKYW